MKIKGYIIKIQSPVIIRHEARYLGRHIKRVGRNTTKAFNKLSRAFNKLQPNTEL